MAWRDVELRAVEEGISPRIIAMEAIQVHLLGAIYADAASAKLGFQGGTCLRLVHGGHRYSEDLDFVSVDLADGESNRLISSAARSAGSRLAVVLGPGERTLDEGKTGDAGKVRTWWFRYRRQGEREVLRVKLELGRYPAHDLSPLAVRPTALPFVPHALVMACSPRELLADKINALAQRAYVKGRDLYDIWFLTEVLGVGLDVELVETKFRDYGTKQPRERLGERVQALDGKSLGAEMELFLPAPTRRLLAADDYAAVLAAVKKAADEVLR